MYASQPADPLKRFRFLALFLVLAGGLALRAYGLDWDRGHFLHPDERFLLQFKLPELAQPWPLDWRLFLDPARSPWNPHWFAYGSLPFYLTKLLQQIAAVFDPAFLTDQVRFLARGLSVAADVGGIVLLYAAGSRLYGWRTGLLAAAFMAFAVVHIQLSHFATFDVLLTFFVLLTLAGAARIAEQGDLRGGALAGLGVGLGLATKISILPVAIPVAAAYALYCFSREDPTSAGNERADALAKRLRWAGRSAFFAALVAGLVFIVAQPYALLDLQSFLRDTREQTEMALRVRDYPYTRQYEGTAPYLYHMQQLATWGLGWPLGIVAWLGVAVTAFRAVRFRQKPDLLLLSWVLPYFLFTGAVPVKFMRYMLPITPVLLLLGARMLVLLAESRRASGTIPIPGSSSRETTGLRPSSSDENALPRPGIVPSPSMGEGKGEGALRRSPILTGVHLAAGRSAMAARVLVAGVLLATAGYALAFTNIYRQEHPALRVAEWVRANVPPGATLLKEHWEEGIPTLHAYKQEELALYEPDTPAKADRLAQQLASADYIVFYSNRLYGTIPRLPERYPMASRYYQALFSGELGFSLAYSAAAYPSLLGVTLVDGTFGRPGLPQPQGLDLPGGVRIPLGYADESFTAYDHPRSMVFKKERPLSAAELRSRFTPESWGPQGSGQPGPAPRRATEGLLLSPEDLAAQRAGGTWSEIFDVNSWTNSFPVVAWLLAIEVIGLVALPLAAWLFPSFPDRGFLLSKAFGWLATGYLAWLASSTHLLPFARGTLLLSVVALAAAGAVVAAARPAAMRQVWGNWRRLLLAEGVFLAAFFALLMVRSANPDLWHPWRGGEKPMDFAFLNAIVKSTYMPPYDPWYSGGYINYYYFGQFLVAALVKLTGILPEVAYNLAIPTLYALLAGAAFSVGWALAAPLGRRGSGAEVPAGIRGSRLRWPASPTPPPSPPPYPSPIEGEGTLPEGVATGSTAALEAESPRRGAPAWMFGLAAALFTAVCANLDGAVQVVEGLRRLGGVRLQSSIPLLAGTVQAAAGVTRAVSEPGPLPAFDYWRSRSMGGMDPSFIDPTLRASSISITEFPFFTFLFADLHAHLIALPFALLAIGFVAETALGGLRRGVRGNLAFLAAFALVLGALRWTNSWDYPTYLALAGAGLFIGGAVHRGRADVPLLFKAALGVLVLVVLSVLAFFPFQATYQLFYGGGILPSPEQTPPLVYLRIHGLYLAILGGFLASAIGLQLRSLGTFRLLRVLWRRRERADRAWGLAARLGGASPGPYPLLLGAGGASAVVALAALTGTLTAGLLILFLFAAAWLGAAELVRPTLRPHERGTYLVILACAGLAGILSLFVEVAKFDIPGEIQRMNNVFKLYLQVWVLLGIASAAGLWWTLRMRLWPAVMGSLFAAALVYPLLATPVRVADRFSVSPPGLDGAAYMATAVYPDERGALELRHDYEAIRWLRENVQGSPVVLEGITPIYRWGSRVSIYTGLPTVLGWDWHETQQRWDYREAIERRKRDVDAAFASPAPADALTAIQAYGVSYVYVGPVERSYYPPAGLAKFEGLARDGLLREVYRNGQVVIYRVEGR